MPRSVVLSDVHGNLPALRSVWLDASHRTVDHTIFLGDLVAFGPHPLEVVEYLSETVKPQISLRGNTDRYLIEKVWKDKKSTLPQWTKDSLEWTADKLGKDGLAFLETLTDEQSYEVEGVEVFLCHASPGDDETGVSSKSDADGLAGRFAPHEGKTVLCGHTHWPYRTRLSGAAVINVGSVGLPFDRDQRGSFLTFIAGGGRIQELSLNRASYPIHGTIADLEASDMPGKEVILHRLLTASSSVPRGYGEESEDAEKSED